MKSWKLVSPSTFTNSYLLVMGKCRRDVVRSRTAANIADVHNLGLGETELGCCQATFLGRLAGPVVVTPASQPTHLSIHQIPFGFQSQRTASRSPSVNVY